MMMSDEEFKAKLDALSELDQLLIGAAFAEHVLPNWEREFPDDDRPRKAIEAKRAFARGEITREELDKALAGAYYAAEDVNHIWEQTSAWFAAYSAAGFAALDAAECAAECAAESAAECAAESAARSADDWDEGFETERKWQIEQYEAFVANKQNGEPMPGGDSKPQTITEQVREFHQAFGAPTRERGPYVYDAEEVQLRLSLIAEEFAELVSACSTSVDIRDLADAFAYDVKQKFAVRDDDRTFRIAQIADALADLDYVIEGTRQTFGIPRQPIADLVHANNMTKFPDGKALRNEHGKLIKPPGFKEVDLRPALREAGHDV